MPDGGASLLLAAAGSYGGTMTAMQAVMYVVASNIMADQRRSAANKARDAYNASLKDRYVMLRGATEPRQFVLGRQRASGPIAFMQSEGTNRTKLAGIVLLAAHECDAIETVVLDDDLAVLDANGYVIAVERTDEFAISTSTATVGLSSAPLAYTVTATATYGATVVPLTVTGVSGLSVSVSGARAGVTGSLKVVYHPLVSPYLTTSGGADITAVLHTDSSGAGSVTVPDTILALVGAVYETTGGGDAEQIVHYDVTPAVSYTDHVFSIAGGPVSRDIVITYRALETTASPSRAKFTKHLGTPGQAADPDLIALFPGVWTSDHKVTDQTYLKFELDYDPDAFPGGVPNISAVVRGAKLYDPRTGLTAYSENPALMVRYVALHPLLGAQPATAVNDTNIAAVATICDQVVTYTVNGVDYVRPLYTAGLTVKTGTRPADAITSLCDAMAGRWCVIDGALRLRAGASATPLQALDETWLAGEIDGQAQSIEIQAGATRADSANTATGKFADADRAFQEVDYPQVTAAGWSAADGAELPLEVNLPAVTFVGQAQQVVAARLRDARLGQTLVVTCNMRAFAVEPFDVLPVNLPRFGFSGKLFEVQDVQWTVGGGIRLVLKATDPSIWALGTSFDAVPLSPPTRLPSAWYVPAVTGLAAASGTANLQMQADGTIVSTLLVTWDAITDAYVTQSGGGVEVKYGLATEPEADWRTARAPEATGSVRLADVCDGWVYLVKARAYTALAKGAWSSTIRHQVVGKTAAPATATGLSGSVAKGRALWAWAPCVSTDYWATEIRTTDANWGADSPAPLWRGTATSWAESVSATGTLTRYVRHLNTSGIPSAATASASVSVASADLIGALAALNTAGTAQLQDQSATVVAESFSAGPLSVTGSTNVKTVSVSNPDSAARQVIVHGTFSYTGTAGAGGVTQTLVITDGSSPVGVGPPGSLTVAPGASTSATWVFSQTFMLAAGATGYYSLAQNLSAGSWASMNYLSVTLRTELILK